MGSTATAIQGVVTELHAGQTPKQKVTIIRRETALATTLVSFRLACLN